MRFLLICFLNFALSAPAPAAEILRDGLRLSLSARTPSQLRAFYSARGMPENAVQEIARSCFITAGVHNSRNETVWLELQQWRFVTANGAELTRITPKEWRARWTRLNVPRAAQSTFGWTQLPEVRDLQPDESVGGNIPLLPSTEEFTLIARFALGEQKDRVLEIRVPQLRCATEDTAP